MTQPEQLLAKSRLPGGRYLSLEQHLLDTEQAALHVFRPASRWSNAWCRFFRIEEQERFLLHLRLAALFHDIGKANEDFYQMVSGKGKGQLLRHEHISALVLHLPEVRTWLSQNKDLDLEVITAAVLSHHTKAARNGDHQWAQPRGTGKQVTLFLQHPEIQRILVRIAEVAQLPPPPKLSVLHWQNASPWQEAYNQGIQSATRLGREIKKDTHRCQLLLATKAGLIVSDSIASGLVRNSIDIKEWVTSVAHSEALTDEKLRQDILTPRIDQVTRKNGSFTLHNFQAGAAKQGDRVLLLAACGAGKTLAAWKWAEAQAAQHPIGRVIFLYPTRGTATEGFRDYVGWAPEAEASLVHGTAKYELEAIAQNPSEATQEKNYVDEEEDRLFALALWSKRYFSATVDQFLSFLEHSYKALCLLPALADSALILDEVHSYDQKMFDGLISFLTHFRVPVLCMTATLPPSRKEQLVALGLKVYPDETDRPQLLDLEQKEKHPRYLLRELANSDEALPLAINAYRKQQRVLWVVNTVARCQELARQLTKELGDVVLVYHSRFTLADRQTRHKNTVAAFQQKQQPAIAVTTQVCEMSLDLDADVLFSECAPVSSLVQRFGRANRHAKPGDPFRAELYVYPPPKELPYTKNELAAASRFIRTLAGKEVSQFELATELEQHALAERSADGSSRFLEAGYFATPGQLRDIDNAAATSVLDGDLPELERKIKAREPYDGFLLPVPRNDIPSQQNNPGWLPKYLSVVPSAQYSSKLGFLSKTGGQP
jgi:CRISPR-associated endonuclease/helicase Cas3